MVTGQTDSPLEKHAEATATRKSNLNFGLQLIVERSFTARCQGRYHELKMLAVVDLSLSGSLAHNAVLKLAYPAVK